MLKERLKKSLLTIATALETCETYSRDDAAADIRRLADETTETADGKTTPGVGD